MNDISYSTKWEIWVRCKGGGKLKGKIGYFGEIGEIGFLSNNVKKSQNCMFSPQHRDT